MTHSPSRTLQSIQFSFASQKEDRYVGVRALWIRVIVRAVYDWVSYRDSIKLQKKKDAFSAERWLFHPNKTFNGFENVCYIVGVDPEKIRQWSRSISKKQVVKMEHLERIHPEKAVKAFQNYMGKDYTSPYARQDVTTLLEAN